MLLDVAAEFFDTSGWTAERHPKDAMLRATFEGENGTFPCYVVAYEDKDQLGFYAVLPDLVPTEHHDDVAILAGHLNYGLTIGNFELDYDSGELRFRAGIDVEGGELTVPMVKSMAAVACLNLDFYRSAFEAVASGSVSPADAVDAMS